MLSEKLLKDQIADLESSTESSFVLQCTQCYVRDERSGDREYALTELIKKGWRGTPQHVLCPDCSKEIRKPE